VHPWKNKDISKTGQINKVDDATTVTVILFLGRRKCGKRGTQPNAPHVSLVSTVPFHHVSTTPAAG
jgi:hypothetical protein